MSDHTLLIHLHAKLTDHEADKLDRAYKRGHAEYARATDVVARDLVAAGRVEVVDAEEI